LKGKDLLGKRYQPIYLNQPISPADYQIVGADWVSIEEGSGLVHIAPAFGEDDMALGKSISCLLKLQLMKKENYKWFRTSRGRKEGLGGQRNNYSGFGTEKASLERRKSDS